MQFRLLEMHGAYPLFVVQGLVATTPPIAGRIYDVTWHRAEGKYQAVCICETHEGQGGVFSHSQGSRRLRQQRHDWDCPRSAAFHHERR